jgi:hypothetical protein
MLSPALLEALRAYWSGLDRKPSHWLFPGGFQRTSNVNHSGPADGTRQVNASPARSHAGLLVGSKPFCSTHGRWAKLGAGLVPEGRSTNRPACFAHGCEPHSAESHFHWKRKPAGHVRTPRQPLVTMLGHFILGEDTERARRAQRATSPPFNVPVG